MEAFKELLEMYLELLFKFIKLVTDGEIDFKPIYDKAEEKIEEIRVQ